MLQSQWAHPPLTLRFNARLEQEEKFSLTVGGGDDDLLPEDTSAAGDSTAAQTSSSAADESDDAAADGTLWQLESSSYQKVSASMNSLLLQGADAFDSTSGSSDDDGEKTFAADSSTEDALPGRGAISITLPKPTPPPISSDSEQEQPSRVIVLTPHDHIRSVMHDVGNRNVRNGGPLGSVWHCDAFSSACVCVAHRLPLLFLFLSPPLPASPRACDERRRRLPARPALAERQGHCHRRQRAHVVFGL